MNLNKFILINTYINVKIPKRLRDSYLIYLNGDKMKNNDFECLAIETSIKKAIKKMDFNKMTDIQSKAIPLILEGNDVVGISHTGTGKTLAFGIPAIHLIDKSNAKRLQVLILCPTRELAIQTYTEIKKLYAFENFVKAQAIYGGDSISKQIMQLKKGVNIVIGTPGRVQDHINRKTIRLDHLKMLVLDEADEMLNMGFREDIDKILNAIPNRRQTLLFSATMPKAIKEIINNYLNSPQYVHIENKNQVLDLIQQLYYDVEKNKKKEALILLIHYFIPDRAIVFCNTKIMVDELTELLIHNNINAIGLHGDMNQSTRNSVMSGFKSSKYQILIATDVAARGLDIYDVDIVFNYDIPQNTEYYLHRIGRTGRAGKTGIAVSIINNKFQETALLEIKKNIKSEIYKTPIPKPYEIKEKYFNNFIGDIKTHINRGFNKNYDTQLKELNTEGYPANVVASALMDMNLNLDNIYLPNVSDRYEKSKDYHKDKKSYKTKSALKRKNYNK